MGLHIESSDQARGAAGRRATRRGVGALSAASLSAASLSAASLSAAGLLLCATPLDAAVPPDPASTKAAAVRAVEPAPAAPGARRSTGATLAVGVTAAGPELVVSLARAAPAAAFAYGRHVWIVVATEERLSRRPASSAAAGRLFADLELTRLPHGVALRLRRQAGRRLVATRDGRAWHFTFRAADAVRPRPSLSPAARRSTLDATVVAVPGLRDGTVHRLVDPVVGATLLVVTTADPAAVGASFRTPAFTLLPTALGVAVEVRADGVAALPGATGLRVRYRRPEAGADRR